MVRQQNWEGKSKLNEDNKEEKERNLFIFIISSEPDLKWIFGFKDNKTRG